MRIERQFTKKGQDVYSTVEWVERTCQITQSDGSIVFEMKDARLPGQWSQLASDIMVSKYFRKAGVPQHDAEGNIAKHEDGSAITGPERSAKQVIHRLCGCWKHWGLAHGYFHSDEDADAFYDEMAYMLLHQMAAPNSPQWFNTGLNWAYGLVGPAQGHFVPHPQTGEVELAQDAYTHPQPHACFIQSVNDDLVSPGGIMDLWTREARLFKYGSGTGTNFSRLRGEGEPLSGGGTSSGLMSWLKIGDRAAAAIKSGGTTRRAAKMVCLDLDHPDIEQFIDWKVREEIKVEAMVEGFKRLPKEERALASKMYLNLDYDFNGEAYGTVSGQNSNNSIRIPDEFFEAVDQDGMWELRQRTNGKVAKSVPAKQLWDQLSYAAWRCADPGVQFDSTINSWHTCPNEGRINASNPCSEYMFLDNTACNLASINLLKFYDTNTQVFDVESFEHAIRLWTIVLEISVLMAAFPSAEVAKLSYRFRTLGLGFANVGAMLMQAGIPYDSSEARAICSCISAILTGRSYAVSAELAATKGAFEGFDLNRVDMLRVIRNHRRAAHCVPRESGQYESLQIAPVPISEQAIQRASKSFPSTHGLWQRACRAWDEALDLGERFGYRNAQVSVIAPTGTIGLLMDCDTTGVEPDFALVKFKKLAGGGYFKIANNSLRPALRSLGYSDSQVKEIMIYVMGRLTLDVPLPDGSGQSFKTYLIEKGFGAEDLQTIEDQLPSIFEIRHAFSAWSINDETFDCIGIDGHAAKTNPSFNLLKCLGLSSRHIAELSESICGTQTVEGAPHLKEEHLAVFDCANACGNKGVRYIAADGHIQMMAAAQPFISGAISKTINLPNSATVDEIARCYRMSWELGLKANALYRDGCKLSQPLNTKTESDDEEAHDDAAFSAVIDAEYEDPIGLDEARIEVADEVTRVASVVSSSTPQGGIEFGVDDLAVPIEEDSDEHDSASSLQPERIRTVEKIVERIVERPLRRRLPDTRPSLTHKFSVAGHEGYLTVGMYKDGMPGELFITMSKEGSTIGGLMDSLGTAISVALQYGVPLESLVGKFSHQRFEPAGMTDNREIPIAKSLVDYIFRWLGMEFIAGYREQNSPIAVMEKNKAAESAIPSVENGLTKTPEIQQTDVEKQPSADNRLTTPTTLNAIANRLDEERKNLEEDGEDDSAIFDRLGSSTPRSIGNRKEVINGLVDAWIDTKQPQQAPADFTPTNQTGSITSIQSGLQSIAAIADRQNAEASAIIQGRGTALDRAMAEMMGDAPACATCGTITVRNGTCYKCLNCGNSMGCS